MAYLSIGFIKTASKTVLLLSSFCFFAAQANAANTGTINFVGKVVEGGCEMTNDANRLTQTCMQGKERVKQQMTLEAGARDDVLKGKSMSNEVSFHWLDKEKGLGIAEVTYH